MNVAKSFDSALKTNKSPTFVSRIRRTCFSWDRPVSRQRAVPLRAPRQVTMTRSSLLRLKLVVETCLRVLGLMASENQLWSSDEEWQFVEAGAGGSQSSPFSPASSGQDPLLTCTPHEFFQDCIEQAMEPYALTDPNSSEKARSEAANVTAFQATFAEAVSRVDFSADDWVEGQSAALTYGVAADEDAQNHGDGAQNHGDGGLASAVLETMDEEDVDILVEQSTKLRTLRAASKLFKDMGGVLGDSLRNTVSSVIHGETKRLAANQRVPEIVSKELMQGLQAEEATFRIARMQHQEKMTLKKEKEAATKALKEADASLKKAKQDRKLYDK